jgi:carbonic anhydrase
MDKWEKRYNTIYPKPNSGKVNVGTGNKPMLVCSSRCSYKLNYPLTRMTNYIRIYNNNNVVRINYDNSEKSELNYIMFNGDDRYQTTIQKYILRDILLLAPSRHKITNEEYDLEVQLIHESKDDSTKLQVISIMMSVDDNKSDSENYGFFEYIGENIPSYEDNIAKVKYQSKYNDSSSKSFSLKSIIPKNESFYTYNDTDGINYIIFKNIMYIPSSLINNLKSKINKSDIIPSDTDMTSITVYSNDMLDDDNNHKSIKKRVKSTNTSDDYFEKKLDNLSCKPIDLFKYKKYIGIAVLILLILSIGTVMY